MCIERERERYRYAYLYIYIYVCIYIYTHTYAYTNLPVNAIVRLAHPRSEIARVRKRI